MWVAPSAKFSRGRGPTQRTLGWGPNGRVSGAFLHVYVLFFFALENRVHAKGGLYSAKGRVSAF